MQNGNTNDTYIAGRFAFGLLLLTVLTVFSVISTPAQGNSNPRSATFLSTPVGIMQGQTVRVSIINPVFVDGSVRVVRGGHVKVFSGSSTNELVEIPVESIRPGEFHYVDIHRSHLNQPGDPLTGRLQVRVEVRLTFNEPITPRSEVFPPSLELVNVEGGQTILIGMLLPAIQK